MARIRTIKPELPQSESMGRVSREARLCFILMFTLADDAGRLRGHPRLLASVLYPYDEAREPSLGLASILDGWLQELEEQKCIQRYEVDGESYIEICNWLKHQRIDKPSQSKLPEPLKSSRALASPLEPSLTLAHICAGKEGNGTEGKGKEGNGSERSFPPASPEKQTDNYSFDGHDWCLKTCKAHPKWEAPDAVDVPRAIADAYIDAVESHSKSFGGNLGKAADDILARTRQFAKNVEGDKIMVGVLNFFKNGVYLEHHPDKPSQPPPAPMTAEEELAIIEAAERRRAERYAQCETAGVQ